LAQTFLAADKWDVDPVGAKICDHRFFSTKQDGPPDMARGTSRELVEKALRIIRDPVTHRAYVYQIRGDLRTDQITEDERSAPPLLPKIRTLS
jgi:hypothetical protein